MDLDPQGSARDVSMLFQQIWKSKSEDNLAFRQEHVYVSRLARCNKQKTSSELLALKSDSTYLITGGLGGLGQTI